MQRAIEYRVVKSRRKSIAIAMEPGGSVLVKAPMNATKAEMDRVVEEVADQILARQKELRDMGISSVAELVPVEHKYKEGEEFLYLGQAYPLRLVSRQDTLVDLKHGYFALREDVAYPDDTSFVRAARDAFIDFYTVQAEPYISDRVRHFEPMPTYWEGVIIRELEPNKGGLPQWGQCSSRGDLRFDPKIMMAPPEVIDSVVVHEVSHLTEFSHNKAFWKEVRSRMPNYDKYSEWLRLNGVGLTL